MYTVFNLPHLPKDMPYPFTLSDNTRFIIPQPSKALSFMVSTFLKSIEDSEQAVFKGAASRS